MIEDLRHANLDKYSIVVMRFRDTVSLDEAEVLAGRFRSVSARYYVLHDPEKLIDKYITAWSNFGIDVSQTIPVNKSSLTTVDIFQLKIVANRQRINVNWYNSTTTK